MPARIASLPWRAAWQEALYGPSGFYRQPSGPAGQFATATHGTTGAMLASALWAWADRLGADGIVDVGAGRGELLRHLYASAPDRPLTGLDVVARPADLPDRVVWRVSPGGADLPTPWPPAELGRSLVVAHEWLDVVPLTVAEVAQDGSLLEVRVDPQSGVESLGPRLDEADLAWCERWWPSALGSGARPGDRVEVGRSRDDAWAGLLDRLDGGPALAVDYGHETAERPREGTLSAYRLGRLVRPRPDGSCDLTAHVAVDSLVQTRRLSQREALAEVGLTRDRPDHALATTDPAAYLAALGSASVATSLTARGGFGDFWWVLAG